MPVPGGPWSTKLAPAAAAKLAEQPLQGHVLGTGQVLRGEVLPHVELGERERREPGDPLDEPPGLGRRKLLGGREDAGQVDRHRTAMRQCCFAWQSQARELLARVERELELCELRDERVVEPRAAICRREQLVAVERDRPQHERRDVGARIAVDVGQRADREPQDVLAVRECIAGRSRQRGEVVVADRQPTTADQCEHEAHRVTGDRNAVIGEVDQALGPVEEGLRPAVEARTRGGVHRGPTLVPTYVRSKKTSSKLPRGTRSP
ncbi:MAG: hypothetical protein ABI678_11495 [Kofleriaceae bacterium]